MSRHLLALLLLIGLLLPLTSHAFDGKREGFAYCFGLGGVDNGSPDSWWWESPLFSGGVGFRLWLAKGLNGRDTFGVELGARVIEGITGNTNIRTLAAKYHRLLPGGRALFVASIGLLDAQRLEDRDLGWSVSVGFGIEVVDHFMPQLELVSSRVDGKSRTGIGLWVSILAY